MMRVACLGSESALRAPLSSLEAATAVGDGPPKMIDMNQRASKREAILAVLPR